MRRRNSTLSKGFSCQRSDNSFLFYLTPQALKWSSKVSFFLSSRVVKFAWHIFPLWTDLLDHPRIAHISIEGLTNRYSTGGYYDTGFRSSVFTVTKLTTKSSADKKELSSRITINISKSESAIFQWGRPIIYRLASQLTTPRFFKTVWFCSCLQLYRDHECKTYLPKLGT